MDLDKLDRIDDAEAKIAFAKAGSRNESGIPWLAIRVIFAIVAPAIVAIWILLGLLL